MLVEGRHFFAGTDPAAIGHKSLAVNLSDLAAMGARAAGLHPGDRAAGDRRGVAGGVLRRPVQPRRPASRVRWSAATPRAVRWRLSITVFGQVPAAQALRRDARGRATSSGYRVRWAALVRRRRAQRRQAGGGDADDRRARRAARLAATAARARAQRCVAWPRRRSTCPMAWPATFAMCSRRRPVRRGLAPNSWPADIPLDPCLAGLPTPKSAAPCAARRRRLRTAVHRAPRRITTRSGRCARRQG